MSLSTTTPVRMSMRLRLTLWNTSVLALMLTIFGVASWVTLQQVLDRRGDATVEESVRAISGAVIAERRAASASGDTVRVKKSAANAVLRELRNGNLDVLIVDNTARVVAANSTPALRRAGRRIPVRVQPAEVADTDTLSLPPQVRELLQRTPVSGDMLLQRLTIDNVTWRAALIRVTPVQPDSEEASLVVGVLRSDEEDIAILARVRTTLLFAIPFALALSLLAGYTLARRSLAPIEAMADSAARISAATLSERLPIGNPHDELGRLATVINALLGRVDVAFRTQKQFVADASHELRTPIAIVRGEADVTLQRPTREEGEYRDALEVIRDESVRLTRIVDDLFLLARADAASPLDRHERCDLGELLSAGLRAVRTMADEQQIQLVFVDQSPGGNPVTVDGDPGMLRRLLLNLLDNALKHTPQSGQITVSLSTTGTRAVVTVADTGPGIPPELHLRIFERFIRNVDEQSTPVTPKPAGTSQVSTASGAGLGLAIAQAIAHAHGGEIQCVASTAGATFRVELPRA